MKNTAAAARLARSQAYARLLEPHTETKPAEAKAPVRRLRVKKMVPPAELQVKVSPA